VSDYYKDVRETVNLHIGELRRAASFGTITEEDHNTVGLILRDHIGQLIGLSDNAWKMFQRFVNESREVHYNR
jgi:hypothetical protein